MSRVYRTEAISAISLHFNKGLDFGIRLEESSNRDLAVLLRFVNVQTMCDHDLDARSLRDFIQTHYKQEVIMLIPEYEYMTELDLNYDALLLELDTGEYDYENT